MFLIIMRIWHLTVIQHEEKIEESHKPQKRVLVQKPMRASIRDRFNEPLAINRVQYNVSLIYAKIKSTNRKKYIKELSQKLASILKMDAERVEDLIHAKASLLGHIPLVIREELSEEQYFHLKILEKDHPAILAERVSVRHYPHGPVGADIIGYMGPISREEFDKISLEIRSLQEQIQAEEAGPEARQRLKELQERAYTINDYVGKSGIESYFDEHLRGFRGKQAFYSDIKGRFLKELPGSTTALSGNRFLLTISVELQEFAEALLAENETLREGKSVRLNRKTYTYEPVKQPWIKGGAIVAMDPNTGEVLAMASYPRYDPNDFIFSSEPHKRATQKSKAYQWLEHELHIAELWDQKHPLTKELFSFKTNAFYEESKLITWENYLNFILPKGHPVQEILASKNTIHHALKAPSDLSNYDQILLTDLYHVAVDPSLFSPELAKAVGHKTLSHYRQVSAAYASLKTTIQEQAREHFHKNDFAAWKAENQKTFLKEMREKEKQNHSYQKPYLDYLDNKEKELFNAFWEKEKLHLSYHFIQNSNHTLLKKELSELDYDLGIQYLATLRSYQDLNNPLLGHYPSLRDTKGVQLEKHLAAAFYPKHGFGYGRSFAFRQAVQLGSVFKLVTAYTALMQPYKKYFYSSDFEPHDLNPLTIIDDLHRGKNSWNVGYTLDGAPIPQSHKGGRIPKSQHSHIGRVDLAGAIETSSNPYFALLAGDVIESPEDLLTAAREFSYGSRTGIQLPAEIAGRLPTDLSRNKTGTYAFAIGQHSFVATPLQTAVMVSAIANKGRVLEPQIIHLQAGKETSQSIEDLFYRNDYPYKNTLELIGIHFPLFTAMPKTSQETSIFSTEPKLRRQILMPDRVQRYLLNSMKQVIIGPRGTARPHLSRSFAHRPSVIKDYTALQDEMIGKTSTAELQERVDLSADGVQMVNHIGFAGVSFEGEKPELVVIVYLRFGDYGKEAAPIAAQMVKKWREIKAKHES